MFFFSSRRRHTRLRRDWSSDVCSSDLILIGICWGIPLFMLAVSAEIVINFVLNLYRPRMHGESPRPAFDSKTLSLFASPDSLVRSINEAINYQFGFDITSSWGYQLLLRSVAWLIGLAVLVLLCMSAMVVVEPTQQAIRIRQGEIVGQEIGRASCRERV